MSHYLLTHFYNHFRMKIPSNDLNQLRSSIERANTILVTTYKNSSVDAIAACLGLYFSLPTIGKRASVAVTDGVQIQQELPGKDKIMTSLGASNFIISLDYEEGSIEKVSYNIEGDRFNLVIEPRTGFSFSEDKVHYSQGAANADTIIIIGTPAIEDLGPLYDQISGTLNNAMIINIDNDQQNSQFGKINIVAPEASSLSEMVTFILKDLQVGIGKETAENLMQGMREATQNFSFPYATADIFEAGAILAKATPVLTTQAPVQPQISARPMPAPQPRPMMQKPQQQMPQRPIAGNAVQSQAFRPQPQRMPKTQFTPPAGNMQQPQQPNFDPNEEVAPPDWLKPKIFSSRRPGSMYQPKDDTNPNK